ncbi:tRNA-splicing endonuclease subunit Sen2 isoform X4 [Scleropages formosus]|uniref:tRNA-splicing endonuclease subunit Sen2 n=1 Tax=Scleropages formosus TaxID=113540 RepID=A0A8C9QXB4_SCLFO|nr:tRNA-splicing endonuclease subunit Sen2 isoform X4 [Scleropages formosus]
MTEAVFQAPKRRARVYESYEGPFPVPLCADGAGGPEPLVYRADVVNRHVVVRDPAHIGAVYGKGYFGKGVLSRSKPQHSISERFQRFGDQRLPVISSSKYEQHVNWARELLLAQGLDEDVVDEMLQKCVQPVPEVGVEEEEEEGEGQEGVTCSEDRSASTGPLPPCGLSDGERPKPRRQGDPRYDPLAELHERMDRETVDGTHFSRHDGRVEQEDRRCPLPSAGCQYVLVEEEAERHEQAALETNGHRSGVRLVCRINPFQVIEYLQLSPEEAFFLVYALGCLSIYYNEEPLTIANLWEMFCSAQPNFDTTYAAYHYFRSKGWVPKTGVKYGTDFLLYRKGPPFYHASYSVVVEKVDGSFRGATLRPFTWRSLAALNRITGNVSKELMLCYVISPPDLSAEERRSPECMKRLKVQEIIVSRWVSSRERTEQEEI